LINPLRSEREAFQLLVYVLVCSAVIIGLVLLVRAII
jgi:hypothetical protein